MTLDVRTAPVETVTPIKPSEAIRLGSLVAPVQAFGDYEQGVGTACVLGAMNLGYGHPVHFDGRLPEGATMARELTRGDPGCPVADCLEEAHAMGLLPHLNDDHLWSREDIADWLEGLGL